MPPVDVEWRLVLHHTTPPRMSSATWLVPNQAKRCSPAVTAVGVARFCFRGGLDTDPVPRRCIPRRVPAVEPVRNHSTTRAIGLAGLDGSSRRPPISFSRETSSASSRASAGCEAPLSGSRPT